MFETLLTNLKKENEQMIRKMTLGLNQKVDKFWDEFLQVLQEKKLGLEEEVKELGYKKNKVEREVNGLSSDLIKISEGIEREKITLVDLEERSELKAGELLGLQGQVGDITEREKNVTEREKELREKELEIKARVIQLEEKRIQAKRILDKIGG